MKYPRYPAYKYSGVEWIGEIPEHWEVLKLKYIVEKFVGGGTPSTSIENYWDGDIPFVAISDITNSSLISITEKTITKFGMESKQLSLLNAGTILYSIYASVGKVAQLLVPATTNQAVIGLVNSEVKVLNQYLKFTLESFEPFIGFLFSSNTQNNINEGKVKNISIPVPNLEMQSKITEFLDDKIYKIDSLNFQLQNMLHLLQKKRQAIITHAVTKGLDPNVPMKDSGVEWIGEIPEHWTTKKIKHTSYVKGRIGWKGLTSDEYKDEGYAFLVTGRDFAGEKINWLSCYCIDKNRYDDDPYIQLRNGDLLITKDGTIGKLAIVEDLKKPACLNSGIFLVRSINSYTSRFLYWVLRSKIFVSFYDLLGMGSTIQHLYQYVFENFSFPIPPIEEQRQITIYLESQMTKIDALVIRLQKMTNILNEYRSSLISSAVTGKIDVRNIPLKESPRPQLNDR